MDTFLWGHPLGEGIQRRFSLDLHLAYGLTIEKLSETVKLGSYSPTMLTC